MKTLRILLPLLILPLVMACSSVHYVQLSTMRPSQVNYHTTEPQIVVVNNSFVPEGSEYSRYIDENGKQYRLSYDADSIPSQFAMTLATRLYEGHFFDNVNVFFPDSGNITGVEGVPQSSIQQWRYGDEYFVTVNTIKPLATMQIEPVEGFFGAGLTVASTVLLEFVSPLQKEGNIIVTDTLQWYAYGETPKLARLNLPDFDLCIEDAVVSLAVKAADRFMPHHKMVDRYIFVTGHPAMTDAYRYWSKQQYTDASYVWEYVYENAKNKGRRAKAAINLALYYELNDQYEEALNYARSALAIFIDNGDTAEVEYATMYCEDLQQRINEDTRLKQQGW